MSPRVFCPYQPTRRNPDTGERTPTVDLTKAAGHGELVFLLSETANPYGDLGYLYRDAVAKLEALDANEEDYLLLVGHAALTALVASAWLDRMDGRLQMLVWHTGSDAYRTVTGELWQPEDSLDGPSGAARRLGA